MALRVTQNTMYNNMVGHMQQNLSAYMESVQQGSSQKKINRPSDDPAGTYRVLNTRNNMVHTAQYQENVDTARGWLNLADSVLSTNVTTAIKGLKTLAEQAATGTYSAAQRMIMADQARQYFGQLLNLSNTQFEDRQIFAGHKYDQSAFLQGLAPTSWDASWDSAIKNGQVSVSGDSKRTVLVEFQENSPLQAGLAYKWSNDGGETWNTDKVQLGEDGKGNPVYQLKPTGSGVTMTIPVSVGEELIDAPALNEDGSIKYVNKLDDKDQPIPVLDKDGNPVKDENGDPVYEQELAPPNKVPPVKIPNPEYDPKNPYYSKDHPKYDKTAGPDGEASRIPEFIDLTVSKAQGADKDGEGKSSAGAKNGTYLYIRPGAFYQGDDKDPPVDVTLMGAGVITNKRDTDAPNPITATGTFGKNVLVRLDGSLNEGNGQFEHNIDLFAKPGQDFQWSYSTDGGSNWIVARGKTNGDGTVRLPVPGGYMDIDLRKKDPETGKPLFLQPDGSEGTTVTAKPIVDPDNEGFLKAGMQANIHPSRSDLDYEILQDTYLGVNSVGKDVFGGWYEGKPALDGGNKNLFEVVGSFIGYLEGNNQEGCQRTLAALTTAEETVLAEATRIGGMENRVEMAADVLSFQKLDQQERLSYTEDVDLTELLTRLTRQQLTYQTVLQSSSMIMQLSLANYV